MNHILEKFNTLTIEEFKTLPLIAEGESKEIRYLGEGYSVTKLKPTVYSYTHNRCGIVENSDKSRLRATSVFLKLLKHHNIKHSYISVNDNFILGHVMLEESNPRNKEPFIPSDINISDVKYVTPLEIIVKRFLTGTTKHQMKDMSGSNIRKDHPMFSKFNINGEEPFPYPIVRFDWRNPIKDEVGNRLDDKALPEDIADFYVDTKKAKKTALEAYNIVSSFLAFCDIVLYDICLFVTSDGSTLYGEISQDCGRFRHFHLGSLDKDVWRLGGSSEEILTKWNLLADILEKNIDAWILNNPSTSYNDFIGKNILYLGTSNPYKVSEIVSIFPQYREQLKIAPEADVAETGKTFLENATIKAKAYARLSQGVAIAEDSGLSIDILNGNPGIYSARFSDCELDVRSYNVQECNESNTPRDEMDNLNRKFVIKLLNEIKNDPRLNIDKFTARFTCAISICDKDGNILYTCEESVEGTISLIEKGNNGFGYDAIFIGNDTDGLTYAELDSARKNLRSHRFLALQKAKTYIETFLTN